MIELLTAYAPAVVGLLGFALGSLLGRNTRPKAPEPLRPICTCKHGYGSHADGKACQAMSNRPDHWDGYGREDHWISTPCSCLRYDGPSPLVLGLDVT